ncbi:K(+)-transporting ATPase subunit C [Polluticaenibacter yanchengensis]|uniref:Potassium-transporting ATPase KdpC subunit n=1 Tax=Polluticaenibacter yanchengensis TaxID=3014562 RepID=A0ABT4UGB6_9BACT|nr:K(+)-transporting ATPase subunit C [Chitinophagaceae bacterium LY-5]
MKQHILPAIKLTVLTIILFAVLYPLAVWGIAQFAPDKGKGEIIVYKGQKYYSNIGQSFTEDQYFYSRPSAVGYNAAGSAGSNKGPSNAAYLAEVQARIDTFLVHNPEIRQSAIPVELVTASGSGLDPHISVAAATVQVKRIAQIRGINPARLEQLIAEHTDKPLAGLFGPEKINVLKLNIALDEMSKANNQ